MRSRNRSNPFCSPAGERLDNLPFLIDAIAGISGGVSPKDMTPFEGTNVYDESGEAIRQAVNKWIRSTDAFDAIIDFNKAISDPDHPIKIRQEYDSGDHIHPSAAGYKAMADAVDLALLRGIKPVKEAQK
jgi:lysophospholipase L1-like esterase